MNYWGELCNHLESELAMPEDMVRVCDRCGTVLVDIEEQRKLIANLEAERDKKVFF